MSERDVMWTPTVGVGLEHLRLSQDFAGYVASGVIIGMDDGRPFSAWYGIRCDTNWRVRHVNIHMLQDGQKRIELQADGEAHWQSPSGEPLAVLDGCIDVDISATPFTNTLPIRRLALNPGQSAELLVAYLALPEMEVQPDRQRYTCLEVSAHGGLYRYESLSSDFTRDIRVDADGLVVDYPGLFKRV